MKRGRPRNAKKGERVFEAVVVYYTSVGPSSGTLKNEKEYVESLFGADETRTISVKRRKDLE